MTSDLSERPGGGGSDLAALRADGVDCVCFHKHVPDGGIPHRRVRRNLHVTPATRPSSASRPADDNLGRGMEFALVTLVFVGIGLALDAVFGTRPAITIACAVFAFVAQFVKMRYTYSAAMEHLEAERAAAVASVPRATTVAPTMAPDTLPTGVVLDDGSSV